MDGFNDYIVPPVAILLHIQQCSGLVGRSKIVLNIDMVELLRVCGYTWTEVVDALQVKQDHIVEEVERIRPSIEQMFIEYFTANQIVL